MAGLTSAPGPLTLCSPVQPFAARGGGAPRVPTARRPSSAPSAAPSSWCVFGGPPAIAVWLRLLLSCMHQRCHHMSRHVCPAESKGWHI